MPVIQGPIPVASTDPIPLSSPAQGGGNASIGAVEIVNGTPYELVVTGSGGAPTLDVVDSYTRKIVPLSPENQQIELVPLALVGTSPPKTTGVLVLWYSTGEALGAYSPTPVGSIAASGGSPLSVNGLFLCPGCGMNLNGPTVAATVVCESGEPLIVIATNDLGATATSISDNFSTPYTWTEVVSGTTQGRESIWIGTGGAGTGGTVTVQFSGNGSLRAWVLPCVGASSGAGLAALDGYDSTSGSSTSPAAPSITTSKGPEMAVALFAVSGDIRSIASTLPPAPWSIMTMEELSTVTYLVCIRQNISAGTVLAPSFTLTTSEIWDALMVVVLAA